jgi:hypothetical protein
VSVVGQNGSAAIDTTEEGGFCLTGLAAGSYDLFPERWTRGSSPFEPYAVGSPLKLELGEGATLEGIVVRLERSAAVEGTVVGRDGRPRAGATIAIWDANGSLIDVKGGADAAGRFRLEGLRPGTYSFSASLGLETCSPSEPIDAGAEPVVVNLVMEPGTVLFVEIEGKLVDVLRELHRVPVRTVQDARGFIYRGIVGGFQDKSLPALDADRVDRRIGPLPRGTYKVLAWDASSGSDRRVETTVRVDGEPSQRVRLRLE